VGLGGEGLRFRESKSMITSNPFPSPNFSILLVKRDNTANDLSVFQVCHCGLAPHKPPVV
jgi:hypothetical protein